MTPWNMPKNAPPSYDPFRNIRALQGPDMIILKEKKDSREVILPLQCGYGTIKEKHWLKGDSFINAW